MWKLKRWKRKLKKIRKKKNLSDKEINKMLKLYTKINLYEIEQMRKMKEVLSDEDIRNKGRKRRSSSKSKCKGKRRLRKDRSVFGKSLSMINYDLAKYKYIRKDDQKYTLSVMFIDFMEDKNE